MSRRVGVSHDTLRAWERRYGLLQPERSAGGFRLYSDADEARVRDMLGLLKRGLAPAEAARTTLQRAEVTFRGDPFAALRSAMDAFSEFEAQTILDHLIGGSRDAETVVGTVVMPFLRDLGARVDRGEATIAQEHFASSLLRGRLMGLARGWDEGDGPRALLACPPGELHDLGLICLGLVMRAEGWRITFLGADTPVETLRETVSTVPFELVVLACTNGDHGLRQIAPLDGPGSAVPCALVGPGASDELAGSLGCRVLRADPVSVAHELTTAHRHGAAGREPRSG